MSKPVQRSLWVHDWREWQSYRNDRGQPPWIKVHRRLMRDHKWVALTDAQRGHLVSIWILAADNEGQIPDNPALVKKLCYLEETPDLDFFVNQGLLDRDATVTPSRRQGDDPEAKAEAKAEAEQSGEGDNPAPQKPKKDPHAPDKPEFISDELWAEFKSYRTKKKAPLTKKAWTMIENQLVAGMDRGYGPEEMLAETMAAGWQAFRLDWYENRVRYFGSNKPQPDAKDSLIEQASRLRAVQ